MSKEYLYDKKIYLIRVVYAGILAGVVLFMGIYKISIGSSLKYLWMLITFLCIYTLISNFLSLTYPEKIIINDEEIIFKAFKKSHVYSLKDLKTFKIKEQQLANKMYIRVNKTSLFKGRYWIDLKAYNDYLELSKSLLKIEEQIHPDSLKAKIKEGNTIYNERENRYV